MVSHNLGKDTYSPNVQGLQGELVHPATFKIVFEVIVSNKKNLLDGVGFIPVEFDVDLGIRAGSRHIPSLHADVITEI